MAAILIAVVAAFVIGMGYVLSHVETVVEYGRDMFLWCAGAAIVLFLGGLGWDALAYAGSIFVGVVVFLIPALFFSALRHRRERREFRQAGLR